MGQLSGRAEWPHTYSQARWALERVQTQDLLGWGAGRLGILRCGPVQIPSPLCLSCLPLGQGLALALSVLCQGCQDSAHLPRAMCLGGTALRPRPPSDRSPDTLQSCQLSPAWPVRVRTAQRGIQSGLVWCRWKSVAPLAGCRREGMQQRCAPLWSLGGRSVRRAQASGCIGPGGNLAS